MYNILSKILANRLGKVMDKFIYMPQNVFVKIMQILDLVLIANECLDNRFNSGEPGLLCKLGMEKVSDDVNWRFLFDML